jgi:hypothetical protein
MGGFFESLGAVTEQAKAIDAAMGPVQDRLGAAMAQMQQAQAMLAEGTRTAQLATDPDALAGDGQVLAVRDTDTRFDLDPVLEIELLVRLPGLPPYPATVRRVVSVAHLGRLHPGSTVEVRANPAIPDDVHLDLARL